MHRLSIDTEKNTVIVDFDKQEIQLNNTGHWQISPVWNHKIKAAVQNGRIILPKVMNNQKRLLYYCARKILCEINENGAHYLDILIYKDKINTVIDGYSNRSLGHQNDLKENEIHQVLNGKVLELIIWEKKRYIKLLSKGDYIEIPNNAFHCTYVMEENTIVANIYNNVFWEQEFSKKPYFSMINDVNLEMTSKPLLRDSEGNEILLSEGQKKIILSRYLNADEIPEDIFYYKKKYKLDSDIFELMDRIGRGR